MPSVTIYINRQLFNTINQIAEKTSQKASKVIQQALEQGIKQEENKNE